MGSVDDPVRGLHELEKRLEREPEGSQGEIARGGYVMTPRPRAAHGGTQANLVAALRLRFGWGEWITAPEWVAGVLPETTERFDRREKTGARGAMVVGYAWLVDVDRRRFETFANVRGSMVAGRVLAADGELAAEPFGALGLAAARLFPG